MGKYGSNQNHGFGKQIKWAGKNALRELYGHGHYGTVASHAMRWGLFCVWLKDWYGVVDARNITMEMLVSYAEYLRGCVLDGIIEVSYAQNLLSSVNVSLEALRGDENVRLESPSEYVGQRCHARSEVPTGYDLGVVRTVVTQLEGDGLYRASLVVKLARYFGVRLREAVLCDRLQWEKQARERMSIDVRSGTKGGRGKEVERWVPVTEDGLRILLELNQVCEAAGSGNNLLRPDESFDSFVNDGEINNARKYLHACGINSYRDLRSAWACERYQELTGFMAPVFGEAVKAGREVDVNARKIMAPEIGHNRVDVLAAYVGRWV